MMIVMGGGVLGLTEVACGTNGGMAPAGGLYVDK